jgi:hypothetical protein
MRTTMGSRLISTPVHLGPDVNREGMTRDEKAKDDPIRDDLNREGR